MSKETTAIVRQLIAHDGSPAVLATLVHVTGSSYRRPGARLLVDSAGDRVGSISGGCLEEDVLARAKRVAASGASEVVTYDTTSENDLVWGVGLGCHGIVHVLLEQVSRTPAWATLAAQNVERRAPTELAVVWRASDSALLGTRLASDLPSQLDASGVFFQTLAPPTALFVFGAGDDAQPLIGLGKTLGWHVTVADPRPEFTTRERFPLADQLVVAPAALLAGRCAPPRGAVAVVMTHRYAHDVPILRDLFGCELAYIGLLGPKQRSGRIVGELEAAGLHLLPEVRQRLHAPVGLDLGADSPEEVALSIVAEIQAALAGRDARSLRTREKPIHG